MANYGHWHIHECDDCGKGYTTRQNGGVAFLCPDCRRDRRLKRNAEYNERQRNKAWHRTAAAVEVIHDPLGVGGFSPGAQFSDEEVRWMLREQAFTNQTLVLADGERMMVRQFHKGQALVPVRD